MSLNKKFDTVVYQGAGGEEAGAPVVVSVTLDASGNPVTPLPSGRAPASNGVPVTLSVEDKDALDKASTGYTAAGAYVDNTARAAGRAFLANITTSGTATLTVGGTTVQLNFIAGPPIILPLAVTKTVLGTAVGTFFALS